ncbi:MAG TPA: chemotaxis protein CheA [bacterium]|nr:chemotaxis protein CheA [bacterium]
MDMTKYKAMFVSETAEHLQSMNQGLVKIEQDRADKDAIAEVFRNAHSIKGMAASMGYEAIRDLSHAMEDLMDDIREGLREPDPVAMDLLFKGMDTLESLLQDVANDREFSPASVDLTSRIRNFHAQDRPVLAATPAEGAPAPSPTPTPPDKGERVPSPAPAAPAPAAPAPQQPESGAAAKPTKPRSEPVLDMDGEIVFDFKPRSAPKPVAGPGAGANKGARVPSPASAPDARATTASAAVAPAPRTDASSLPIDFELPRPPPPAPATGAWTPSPSPANGARAPSPAPAPAPPRADAAGRVPNKTVRVIFSPQTASPGVRGLILFKRLGEAGEIVESRPPLEDVKSGNFLADAKGLAVEIDFIAETEDDEVVKIMNSMADIQSFELKSLEQRPAAPEPAVEALPREGAAREPVRPEAPYDPFAQAPGLPQTVRVKTQALDRFINALGEMILVKSELREVAKKHPIPALEAGLDRLESLVRDFHDQVMSIRMMPLESVVARLPRVVRDLAKDEGKQVRFTVKGQDIELDRAILEQLADPLIHLLRNCVGHGIEPPDERARLGKPPEGGIEIEAYRLRDLVLIEVRDDGRGMDPFMLKESAVHKGMLTPEAADAMADEDAYQLIFAPGFSTARSVGMVSGRGVGMDAVKNVVEGVGGYVTVSTAIGLGTTFTLHLPRTIAVVNVLLIRIGKETFALPIAKILKNVEILPHQIRRSQGQKFYLERQELVPLKPLHRFLDLPEPEDGGRGPWPALIVELNKKKTALIVDELIGQEEAFIRPLGKPLEKISGLSGVTMLGDGRVVFVLDTMGLL